MAEVRSSRRTALAFATICNLVGCFQAHPGESTDGGPDAADAEVAVVEDAGSAGDASFDASTTPLDGGPPTDSGVGLADGGTCYLPDARPGYPPLQAGSFCDVVWLRAPSSEGITAAVVAAFSDRFYGCDDDGNGLLCQFVPSTTAHLTEPDMELLCAAEVAFPPLEWTCIIVFT